MCVREREKERERENGREMSGLEKETGNLNAFKLINKGSLIGSQGSTRIAVGMMSDCAPSPLDQCAIDGCDRVVML